MQDNNTFVRAFEIVPVQHLRDDIAAEVAFGLYDPQDRGTFGECAIRWHRVSGNLLPRLEMFSDSWPLLASLPDVFTRLGKLAQPSPTEIAKFFVALGFEDW